MKSRRNAPARDHLQAAGKTIYGEGFKGALAAALEVDVRTLRRWSTGEIDLSWDHGVIADLRDLLAAEHTAALDHEERVREALIDLDEAIHYRRQCAFYGDEHSYLMIADDPPVRPTTIQDHARRAQQLQSEVWKRDKVIRDLRLDLAVAQAQQGGGMKLNTASYVVQNN